MENIARPHGFEPLEVQGEVPPQLRGTLFRAGPGVFERFGTRVHHPFEADGVITAVRFGADGISGAARIVKSEGYLEEKRKGRFLYNSSVSFWDHLRNLVRDDIKTTGNTAAFYWRDRLFALMEAGKPQEMDPDTLQTLRAVDFDGVIRGGFSAHPNYVSSLNTHFNFGLRYGRTTEIDLYALPDGGSIRRLGCIEAPWATMIHDFAATEKHLIFVIAPAKLVTWRAITGIGGLSELFRWDPDGGCQVLRVPLEDPSDVDRFEMDSFWLWHTVNAFETATETIVDLCSYPSMDLDFLDDISNADRAHLERLVLSDDGAKRERIWGVPCEFPSVADVHAGCEYRRAFFHARNNGVEGIASYRPSEKTQRFWPCPDGHIPGEPVFVEGGGSPEEGWILSLMADEADGRSYLAVLDTERIEDGPVARIWFDQQLPMSFHGCWAPG